MLFIQGSRDAFGTPDELRPIIEELKAPADLYIVEGGDHSFKVLKRAGITQEDIKEYAKKRDFTRTPEPAGSGGKGNGREFVVQTHAARRLHYDLRLETDGVLKSWAVTKGPSLTAGEKRLAVHTEDHPIEYLNFEGNIPKGEYGAGSMIVWDRGRWEPEGDPQKGLTKGHLAFMLDGARLKGRWHLVQIRPRYGEKTEPWLLIKSDDEFARRVGDQDITEEEVTSQLSGRTNEELAAAGEVRKDHAARARVAKARKAFLPNIGKHSGARKGLLPTFLEPSLALPSTWDVRDRLAALGLQGFVKTSGGKGASHRGAYSTGMLRKRSVQSSFLRVRRRILRPSIRACMR
jgi:DNA ligase D-like protein (predicted 3'-phosphoesterase)